MNQHDDHAFLCAFKLIMIEFVQRRSVTRAIVVSLSQGHKIQGDARNYFQMCPGADAG